MILAGFLCQGTVLCRPSNIFLILASNDTLAPIKAKFQLLSCSVAPGSIKLMFGVVNFQKKLDAA